MNDEVLEFAGEIGATDLKSLSPLFKRRNYFLLGNDKFLVIKVSRNKIRPFWGLRKDLLDIFNRLTERSKTWFFVALATNRSGWALPKKYILSQILGGSLSYSESNSQYIINNYNLKDHHGFTSIEGFLRVVGHLTRP